MPGCCTGFVLFPILGFSQPSFVTARMHGYSKSAGACKRDYVIVWGYPRRRTRYYTVQAPMTSGKLGKYPTADRTGDRQGHGAVAALTVRNLLCRLTAGVPVSVNAHSGMRRWAGLRFCLLILLLHLLEFFAAYIMRMLLAVSLNQRFV